MTTFASYPYNATSSGPAGQAHANTVPSAGRQFGEKGAQKFDSIQRALLGNPATPFPQGPPSMPRLAFYPFMWTAFQSRKRLSFTGTISSTYSSASTLRSLSFRAHILFEHLSSSGVPRIHCKKCNFHYANDLGPLVGPDSESGEEIRRSIDESVPNTVAELTGRLHMSRLILNLARLQLRYALGVFLDRINDVEIEEAVLHQAIHRNEVQVLDANDGSKKSVHDVYEGLNKSMYTLAYQDVPKLVGRLLKDDLALLAVYNIDLKRITSESIFEVLEREADQYFEDLRADSGRVLPGAETRSNSRRSSFDTSFAHS